jgi:hypothetical protein
MLGLFLLLGAVSAPADSLPIPVPATSDTTIASVGDTSGSTAEDGSGPRLREDGVFVGKRTIVTGKRNLHRQKEASRQKLSGEDARKVVATMGDPVRAVNTLPGVAVQSDLSVRPAVRGGKPEETRVFLDGVPLLQPWHFTASASVFHPEATGELKLYSGTFPVSGAGSLSGALYAQSRPAPLDSLQGVAEFSLLKGSLYVGAPVVKGKVGAYVAAQGFWYDFMLKRLLDFSTLLGSDKSSVDEYEKNVNLPSFRDLQWGVDARINSQLSLHYTGYWGHDIYTILEQNDYWRTPSGHLVEESSADTILGSKRVTLNDTSAGVEVNNHVHTLSLPWELTRGWVLTTQAAWQYQDWNVLFSDGRSLESTAWGLEYVRSPSDRSYALTRSSLSLHTELVSRVWEGHQASVGGGWDRTEQEYDTHLERPLAEFMINGNRNLADMLGVFGARGFSVLRNGSTNWNYDVLQDLPDLIRYDYRGSDLSDDFALWASDVWDAQDWLRLRLGLRGERDGHNGELQASPRASALFRLGESDEITVSSGGYSQQVTDFSQRSSNPQLASEKALHGGLEWSHDFDKSWRMELQGYAKSYWDLSAPRVAAIAGTGSYRLMYDNTGTGNSLGLDASLFYDPAPWWKGWVTAGVARSRRQDHEGEPEYPFTLDRPWTFQWVNSFHMPSKYSLDLRYAAWAGQPYTSWRNVDGNSDTLAVVGPRNGERYAPYQRLDIRLSKETTFFRRPAKTYIEVWNAWNDPNMLMRDDKTGAIKLFDLNMPFPIVFWGAEVRF